MSNTYEVFTSLLHARHSCRGFLPDPLDPEKIERIVEAASRVPSWCNAQPWQVIVTSGEETRRFAEALAHAVETQPTQPDIENPARYTGVYDARRKTCGYQLYSAVGVARDDRAARNRQMMENFRFFGAPHVAIVTSEAELGTYGVLDCGGFIAAFTLAAESLGVASIPQAAVALYSPAIRKHFSIPENRTILCAISFGRRDEAHPANGFRTERAPLAEVIDWRQ